MKNKKKALQQRIEALEQALANLQASHKEEQWLDNHDVKKLLNISDSTLWRYRKEKKIPYSPVGNKYLYPVSFFTQSLKNKIINSHLL